MFWELENSVKRQQTQTKTGTLKNILGLFAEEKTYLL